MNRTNEIDLDSEIPVAPFRKLDDYDRKSRILFSEWIVVARRALITGITGQDGSYLADWLLGKGYEVHGLVRRVAIEDPERRFTRIRNILDDIHLHSANLESYPSLFHILSQQKFDECYHLAAQSFVAESFADGVATMGTNVNGTHYLLAALKELQPECRFYFAGSSEMFGRAAEVPQNENTRFHPRSAYGISKVTGFDLTRNYREEYNMFCCSGILFNHESPRRSFEFVTRKITSAVARIKLGMQEELRLGNLDSRRDWGHAKDYVRAMHAMLQQEKPDDFVVATGETHTVREFCEHAFSHAGLDYADFVSVDPKFYRPAEKHVLVGDATKAREKLNWSREYGFEDLVFEMVDADLEYLSSGTSSNFQPAKSK